MKIYVQFFEGDREAIASDGVFILDGRNRRQIWHIDARERMHRLRFVQPHFDGYMLMKGDRFSTAVPISRHILKKEWENGI